MAMQALYVVGGQQRKERPLLGGAGWYDYQRGRILRIDPAAGAAEIVHDYVSPPDVRPDENPTILFKSATVEGDTLYACTQTEILMLSLPSFELTGYVSHPCFNDLHHVRPTLHGTLLAANSGLDMVVEVTSDGRILREWNVLGEDPWERFSKDVDYRKVRSTKPHRAHPNYVFYVGDDIWVTRFEQGDVVCLTRPGIRVEISSERIHDGLEHEGLIYFTSVDGKIVVVDRKTIQLVDIVDLNPLHGRGELMGWCRGLAFDDDERLWVGFSRLRPTQFRDNVAWVKKGFKRMKATHLACFDLERRDLALEIEVERDGLHAIFSIFPDATSSETSGDRALMRPATEPP